MTCSYLSWSAQVLFMATFVLFSDTADVTDAFSSLSEQSTGETALWFNRHH